MYFETSFLCCFDITLSVLGDYNEQEDINQVKAMEENQNVSRGTDLKPMQTVKRDDTQELFRNIGEYTNQKDINTTKQYSLM